MSKQLDRAELTQRFKGQGADLVIQVASLLQGGILSAAAFSLIEIFRTQDDTLVRLILWLMSVILSLVIFFRVCQRAPFLTRAGADVLFMVPIMGLFEIILFAVLASTTLGPGSWRYWYIAATLFAVASFFATWLNLRALNPGQYADDAKIAFSAYKAMLRRSCFHRRYRHHRRSCRLDSVHAFGLAPCRHLGLRSRGADDRRRHFHRTSGSA